jgi:PPOX class probable F420-dependent enzyme
MDRAEALSRLGDARVGHLATADASGKPHVVPFVFALVDGRICWAVDRKPKRSARLRRMANIEANPRVSVLVDHYDEDWPALWWVRVDGIAAILPEGPEKERARVALLERYPQYRIEPPDGPFVAIGIDQLTWWEARG